MNKKGANRVFPVCSFFLRFGQRYNIFLLFCFKKLFLCFNFKYNRIQHRQNYERQQCCSG